MNQPSGQISKILSARMSELIQLLTMLNIVWILVFRNYTISSYSNQETVDEQSVLTSGTSQGCRLSPLSYVKTDS